MQAFSQDAEKEEKHKRYPVTGWILLVIIPHMVVNQTTNGQCDLLGTP